MKKGDKVLVPTGEGDHTVEGVVKSVSDDHAMCIVPAGSMSMGRRSTKALRKIEDLTPVGGGKKTTKKTAKKAAKKKTTKKKATKKKATKKKR